MAVGHGFLPGAPMTAITSLSHLRFNPPAPVASVASCGDCCRLESGSTTRQFSECTRVQSDMSRLQSLASHMTAVPTSSSLEDAKFPMYVVSVEDFLAFDLLPSHEELLEQDLLFQVKEKATAVHFVSQRWLSAAHPDPEALKLRRFQEVLQQLRNGEVEALFEEQDWAAFAMGSAEAELTEGSLRHLQQRLEPGTFRRDVAKGYVWWDYLSVPQKKNKEALQKQSAAIVSLPCYLEACKYFWALVPEAREASSRELVGYEDWQARGWCRMEEWGNFLSMRRAPPLVVTQGPHLGVVDDMDFLTLRSGLGGLAQHAPCFGQFSCCEANHRQKLKNGLTLELRCDKAYVGGVLEMMYHNKLQHCRRTGNGFLLKLLQCSAYSVLAGSEAVSIPRCMEDLLERCDDEEVDSSYEGLTPLGWACTYSSVPLVRELLAQGARADQSVQVLVFAAQTGNVELFDLLFSTGDLSGEVIQRGSPEDNITALDRSAQLGHIDFCSRLLSARASPHPVRRDNGQTPLHTAADAGHPEVCELLLKAGAGMDVGDKHGRTPLMLAAQRLSIFGRSEGKAECAQVLLQASADPEISDNFERLPRQVAMRDGHFSFLDLINEFESKQRAESLNAPREEDLNAAHPGSFCSRAGCIMSSLLGCSMDR